MKKFLVVALATIAFAAQGYAAGAERDGKGKDEAKTKAGQAEARAAGARAGEVHVDVKLRESKLATGLGMQAEDHLAQELVRPINDDLAADVGAAIILSRNKPALRSQSEAVVEGALLQTKASVKVRKAKQISPIPEEKAQQAHSALIEAVAQQKAGAGKSGEHAAKMLEIANRERKSGKSWFDSMEIARKELEKEGIKISLEDLFRLCKKA